MLVFWPYEGFIGSHGMPIWASWLSGNQVTLGVSDPLTHAVSDAVLVNGIPAERLK